LFAQQVDQGGAFNFYEKGNVRIRYQEVGSGFPLLVTPGGGLNSRISNWQTAVINAMAEFKNDFRCITMDQRNATGGESTVLHALSSKGLTGTARNKAGRAMISRLHCTGLWAMRFLIGTTQTQSWQPSFLFLPAKPAQEVGRQCDLLSIS
jgi:pimeloyl-ACP methyl ester carboxylesterase